MFRDSSETSLDSEVSTVLLPLSADSADGIPGKSAANVDRKATGQTIENENAIVAYLAEHGESKSAEIAASIGLGTSHTNDPLRDLVDGGVVKAQGGSRNRTYRIAEQTRRSVREEPQQRQRILHVPGRAEGQQDGQYCFGGIVSSVTTQ